jgi:Family of unknown function (DUF6282)
MRITERGVPLFRQTASMGVAALIWMSVTVGAAWAQVRLDGVIDIHAHSAPDSTERSIDAIDLAKLAKARGMRGLVLKNHYESTASLAYIVRKEVPGIEIFGGIDLNLSVGGINTAAVERMILMKGGYGKIVWMPTFDSENQVKFSKENRPYVSVSKDGQLLPAVKDVIALVAKNQLTLETGHSSALEGLMIVREGKRQGVQHIVVTHAMAPPIKMTIPQMAEAVRDGAMIEFVYGNLIGPNKSSTAADFANAIRSLGPANCILSSDLGQPNNPVHPDGLATYFEEMRKEGVSQADIDLMSQTNPAKALGLK